MVRFYNSFSRTIITTSIALISIFAITVFAEGLTDATNPEAVAAEVPTNLVDFDATGSGIPSSKTPDAVPPNFEYNPIDEPVHTPTYEEIIAAEIAAKEALLNGTKDPVKDPVKDIITPDPVPPNHDSNPTDEVIDNGPTAAELAALDAAKAERERELKEQREREIEEQREREIKAQIERELKEQREKELAEQNAAAQSQQSGSGTFVRAIRSVVRAVTPTVIQQPELPQPTQCEPVVTEYLLAGANNNDADDVSAVQDFLQSHNYSVAVTGIFDSATVSAVKNFQRDNAAKIIDSQYGAGYYRNLPADKQQQLEQLVQTGSILRETSLLINDANCNE